MRRSAAKKTGQSNSTPNAAADLFRSASSKASSKESERIDTLFYSYANGSTGLIEWHKPFGSGSQKLKQRWWSSGFITDDSFFNCMGTFRNDLKFIVLHIYRLQTSVFRLEIKYTGMFMSDCKSVGGLGSESNRDCPDGIETLCADMEVDHTDVRVLMLAWKMKAEEQGYFTLDEWRRGLKALRADTVSKLKKALPDLEKEVRRPSNFGDFYSYAFQYCLTEEKQKSIDIESICELLTLVLGSTFPAQVSSFVEYLKTQNDYKVINKDQWMGFFRFCNEISFPTFNGYDPELAWPLILDNFVDWVREKQK
ncbi:hypothetical protein Fmac_012641 [Flemingia macrophylla]|uniref:Defective in cullin neddylation protein n=1 Tax=Flemingia macrophylla TaxID=520843 RepID=A0ABD1MT22_9FABA